MRILAIDTSTRSGSVAILQNSAVIEEISAVEETPYSERLFRDVNAVLYRTGLKMGDIDVFAVSAGPGSFTGLRVGLAAVKGWAEVHGKPIAAVSGLEAIAAQAGLPFELAAAFLDARRGQVYGALYQRMETTGGEEGISPLGRIGEEYVLSAEEFLALVQDHAGGRVPLFVSPTPEVLPESLIESKFSGARMERVSVALASVIGRLGFERAQRREFVDPVLLDANYVRRTDAELFGKGA